MTLSSMLGSTTLGFGSSHGAGGSTTALYSIFTPPSLAQAAAVANATGRDITAMPPQANPLLMLHGFNAQNIHLLTQSRGTHASQVLKPLLAASLREAAHVGARAIGVLKTGQLVKEALEEGQQKLQDDKKKSASAAAATGGGGDDKDPEKKTDGGTQVSNVNLYKDGRVRIDVENPNPAQRPGNIHVHDDSGNKFFYDSIKKVFYEQRTGISAPRKIQDLLSDPEVIAAIKKGEKILGISQ